MFNSPRFCGHPNILSSLVQSEILRPRDLEDRDLGGPIHLQRLYSSSIQGRAAFFEYLQDALQNYKRRIIIFKVSDSLVSCRYTVTDIECVMPRLTNASPRDSFSGVTFPGMTMSVFKLPVRYCTTITLQISAALTTISWPVRSWR